MTSRASSTTKVSPDSSDAESKLRPFSNTHLKNIVRLIQLITRTFYNDISIIIVDQLVGIQAMPIDILASRLGSTTKEINSHCAKLVEDGIISLFRRTEAREVQFARSTPRSYYYIDYRTFLDVLKWRLMKMTSSIESALKSGIDEKGYVCPRCKKTYKPLDVGNLIDLSTGTLICETVGCATEVVDNEDKEEIKLGKDRVRRFNIQCERIRVALRDLEGVKLPNFDVALWVSQNSTSLMWRAPGIENAPLLPLKAPTSSSQASSLSSPSTSSDADPSNLPGSGSGSNLKVEMISNDPKSIQERRRKEEEEKESMRRQNSLASWHTQSTVSGEKTSLGRREEERIKKLQGLDGTVKEGEKEEVVKEKEVEDYYASYAAMQEAEPEKAEQGEEEKRGLAEEKNGKKRDREESSSSEVIGNSQAKRMKESENENGNENGSVSAAAAAATGGAGGEEEEDLEDFEEVI